MTGWLMRRLPASSFAWLILHELRVSTRTAASRSRVRWLGWLFLAAFTGIGILLAIELRDAHFRPSPLAFAVVLTAAIGLLTFMTTQAMLGSQRALYEVGDLDLLFSAPLPQHRVLLAKLAGIAASVVLAFGVLTLPFLVPVALLGHPQLFGAVALLVALALIAASVGLALTLSLARLAGPRTARTVGQIAAALFGGALFLASQLMNDGGKRNSALAALFKRFSDSGAAESWPGSLPGEAAFGDPLAILVVLGGAILLFAATGFVFQRLFLSGFQDAGTKLNRNRVSRRGFGRHFRPGLFGSVFRKEWLLLARDPALAFQIVLRLVYLAPLVLVAYRHHDFPVAPGLAFLSVAIAGQLVGSFAWLAIAAEDTPDLITVAPVEKAIVHRVKLASALVMAAPLAIILPIGIAGETLLGALVTLLFTAIGGALAGLLELKLGKPAPRKTFARRRSGSVVVGILTLLITGIFGGIAAGIVLLLV
jgi:ABC-2 type transport system permease protein